ncbi:MAG TPA: hypothetical protein VMT63_11305 [Bacteroidales bacterium]|nr:hypothetical protein [Bacteroidales bacterium]
MPDTDGIIYIVDIIGRHSGMHYYNTGFRSVLSKTNADVRILSNYNDPVNSADKVFSDYYKGNLPLRASKFMWSLCHFYWFLLKAKRGSYVFLTYGNLYELLFILPLLMTSRLILDIHEIYPLRGKNVDAKVQNYLRKLLYKKLCGNVIYHSVSVEDELMHLGFSGKKVLMPHLKYDLGNSYNPGNVGADARDLIVDSKVNILYFGQMRITKGPAIVAEIIELLMKERQTGRYNIVIAGSDPHDIFDRTLEIRKLSGSMPVSRLKRYINDDELKFLFTKCDIVFLPYTHMSQSGILEMAVTFRKPVISSSENYFKTFFEMFPSFGYAVSSGTVDDYIVLINRVSGILPGSGSFYSESDLISYYDFKSESKYLDGLKSLLER